MASGRCQAESGTDRQSEIFWPERNPAKLEAVIGGNNKRAARWFLANAALKKGASSAIRMKVSDKGPLSVYGMGPFPSDAMQRAVAQAAEHVSESFQDPQREAG